MWPDDTLTLDAACDIGTLFHPQAVVDRSGWGSEFHPAITSHGLSKFCEGYPASYLKHYLTRSLDRELSLSIAQSAETFRS